MPAIQTMDPKAVREMFTETPPLEVELAPLVSVEDRLIAVGKNEKVKIRIYTPKGEGPFPLFYTIMAAAGL
ncbi:acetyl esterase [Lentibacillus persicus]|uniref:Acetyl esterase n=1 Tax=Lentibacillus persicus TaxID=640948 RepID=A0A1I1S9P5_9BACI|nr:hypothetical protein [Lentibacillus persicus]SFD43234.1 acetyl esterase [Lentibacillus persicus]